MKSVMLLFKPLITLTIVEKYYSKIKGKGSDY